MRYVLLSFIFFLLSLLLTSCSTESKQQKTLKIATNSWIGYTPLFYAKEKGYLQKNNIQLLSNVSLAEAAELYSVGKADMVTTTQHEYYALKSEGMPIVPTILIDRSNGGDMVLSNRSLTDLQKAKSITAYLEIDSINAEILQDFLKLNNISLDKLTLINKDQAQIQDLEIVENENLLVVTYTPYNIALQKRGFKVLASTKDLHSIIVIDALCCSTQLFETRKQELKNLKSIIDRSIEELMQDKEASYKLVKPYLGNLSYAEYLDALKSIVWINNPSAELLEKIEPLGYKKKYLIQ
jgi:NitT/TauT family transport system substrate-binding protein